MAPLEDEDDSASGSSENDADENMDELDEGDGDAAGEMEADMENEDQNEDNEEEEDPDETQDNLDDTPTKPNARQQYTGRQPQAARPVLANRGEPSNVTDERDPDSKRGITNDDPATASFPSELTAPATPVGYKPAVRIEALNALVYDIVPTIAAPHSTSINTVAATPDMRWVFSGGSDGWVRKFNWVDTANGKSMLTVAQRHPFVDSVTKAGVLMSYWENEDTLDKSSSLPGADEGLSLSPVYSLAVHHEALWLLSGTESGGINLQSVRHDEGKRITSLYKHTSAVSVMVLSNDERSLLSGSWDKTILDWDLHTGQIKRSFLGSGSQISAVEMRPTSNLPIPRKMAEFQPAPSMNGTFTNTIEPKPFMSNGTKPDAGQANPQSSPGDSLFNDNDSLFGEDEGGGGDMNFTQDDADDTFAQAMRSDLRNQPKLDADGDLDMGSQDQPDPGAGASTAGPAEIPFSPSQLDAKLLDEPLTNGLLPDPDDLFDHHHLPQEPLLPPTTTTTDTPAADLLPAGPETTFLDASIDGTIRIWDRRIANPVARITPHRAVPPWCMHACWSPDGNYIYAGRRNGTVDEYSLHKGLHEPRRSLRFPAGSGAVSAVRAMPNGRHLVCASHDILRLYDLQDDSQTTNPTTSSTTKRSTSTVPFLIVPGHRTGVVSQLYVDPTCSFMISTGGNRGWEGGSTEVLLGYEIGVGR